MSNKSSPNSGVGVLGLLGVAFVVLKLMGYINWSWIWVTAPFWIVLAVVLVVIVIYALVLLTHPVASKAK